MREIDFASAIAEATVQSMRQNPAIFMLGVGVADPKGIFGTTKEAFAQFGEARVMEVPLSENTIMGAAIGMAIAGLHPLVVHARNDFLMLCMDQIINQMAKWNYMSNGECPLGLTVRAIIGRGWGQGPQHSQSLQAMFCHVPGLKVVMPATAHDAKGLLMSALREPAPVLFLEHRWLHGKKGVVPEESYFLPIGKGKVVREGRDITVVATSYMVWEALEAARTLSEQGIEVEIIDPMTLAPLDRELIYPSVQKTKNLLVADTGWANCGLSAEIVATVTEREWSSLKNPPLRLTIPHSATPCSAELEKHFYPTSAEMIHAIKKLLTGKETPHLEILANKKTVGKMFQGPF